MVKVARTGAQLSVPGLGLWGGLTMAARAGELFPNSNGAQPQASIIVCTYNRADMLRDALRSILQDGSRVTRELIVIDNGSTDGTADIVRDIQAERPDLPLRYEVEARIGHSFARNLGVSLAAGEFLLFTDDDVLVRDGWADALVAGFQSLGIGAVGGRIVPRWPFPPPEWMCGPHAERLTLPDYGPEARLLGENNLPVGANMAIRADLARSFETPFDPRLGRRGSGTMDNEEWKLMQTIAAHHELAYRPDAVVIHRILPERVDWHSMRKSYFQVGFGTARRECMGDGFEAPPFHARLVGAARAYRAARQQKRQNERDASPSADDAWREFSAYAWAGAHLEMLLGRFPRVSGWMAGHLA